MNPITKSAWKKAVRASDESKAVKTVLLRISWHMSEDGRRSSIAVSQLARECRLSENTVKRALRAVRGVWIEVEFNKGIKRPTGRENLYHARLPEGGQIGHHKGGQKSEVRGVGSNPAMAPVPNKKGKTVSQEGTLAGSTSTVPPTPASNVISFTAARERLRATQPAERRAS